MYFNFFISKILGKILYFELSAWFFAEVVKPFGIAILLLLWFSFHERNRIIRVRRIRHICAIKDGEIIPATYTIIIFSKWPIERQGHI